MSENDYLPIVVLATLFVTFAALGVHQAISKLLKLLDGHLERFQGKLDVLLVAQVEHNDKVDLILKKLY